MKKNKFVFPEDVRKIFAERETIFWLMSYLTTKELGLALNLMLLKDQGSIIILISLSVIKASCTMEEVSLCVAGLTAKNGKKNIEWVVFILMPFPIEHMIFEEGDKSIIRIDDSRQDKRTGRGIHGAYLSEPDRRGENAAV